MTIVNASSMLGYGSTWETSGYSGSGNVKDIINSTIDRPAVIVGSARGTLEELEIVKSIYGPDDLIIYGVNDIGMYLYKMDHWVSLHGDNMPAWKSVRWLHDVDPSPTKIHSYINPSITDYLWTGLSPLFALSGYFAMQIAYLMGCSPIILCGCPGDGTPRFFESKRRDQFAYGSGPGPTDKGIRDQVVGEMNRLPKFKSKVRSMSGWTMSFFGAL